MYLERRLQNYCHFFQAPVSFVDVPIRITALVHFAKAIITYGINRDTKIKVSFRAVAL